MKKLFIGSLIALASFCSNHGEPYIKVQCAKEGYEKYWEKSFSLLVPELEKRGIRFVEQDPDVILCYDVTNAVLQKNVPVVKLERWDASTLKKSTFDILMNPLVKGIFKNTVLQPVKMFNTIQQINGRHHFEIIQRYAQLPINFKIIKRNYSPEMLKKLFLVPWDCYTNCFSPKFDSSKKLSLNLDQKRPIDVFCVGSFNCSLPIPEVELYCWHRKKAHQVLIELKGMEVLALAGRPFQHEEYIQKIRESKIVVSPWGWGEWCYRDCEAMANGAVLIKPDTSFVKTMPQLYINNVTYVPCKPDFSDLEEKIRYVLKNYSKFKEMRKRARMIMVEKTHISSLANHFVKCLRVALAQ